MKVSSRDQAKLLVPYLRNSGKNWWIIWELIKRGTCFYFDQDGELVKTTTPDPNRTIIEFKKLKIVEG